MTDADSEPVCMLCGGPGRYNEHARFVGDAADRIRSLEARVAELDSSLRQSRRHLEFFAKYMADQISTDLQNELRELLASVDAALGGKP